MGAGSAAGGVQLVLLRAGVLQWWPMPEPRWHEGAVGSAGRAGRVAVLVRPGEQIQGYPGLYAVERRPTGIRRRSRRDGVAFHRLTGFHAPDREVQLGPGADPEAHA